jgi:Arc/MetJ-type ribon-helix-helix transcriptional regulator
MHYQFPPDLDERVKAQMARRGLQSEDELLRQAMDALDQLEQEKLQRWHERNDIAIEQSRRGLSKPLDLDSILDRVEGAHSESSCVRGMFRFPPLDRIMQMLAIMCDYEAPKTRRVCSD